MTEHSRFDRLTRNWRYWSGVGHLRNPSVSTGCEDCTILFRSDDYAVHLRHDGTWWSVDTVDERRRRSDDTARFTSYELAEKYLVWIWGSTARSIVRAPVLGRQLYARGFDAGIERRPISEGIYELRTPAGRAVLMEPYATIFSHLINTPEEQIEHMLEAELGG